MLRAKSTVLTGDLGNSVIATAELGGASVISLLALGTVHGARRDHLALLVSVSSGKRPRDDRNGK
jgi:hypothetical protein